jgi:hypothetical protein
MTNDSWFGDVDMIPDLDFYMYDYLIFSWQTLMNAALNQKSQDVDQTSVRTRLEVSGALASQDMN